MISVCLIIIFSCSLWQTLVKTMELNKMRYTFFKRVFKPLLPGILGKLYISELRGESYILYEY